MKNVVCLFCLLLPALLPAQTKEESAYLLDQFTTGIATSKRSVPVRADFNYDCVKQEMHFLESGDILKLTPISQVDTLFLGTHKMIPYDTRFLDLIHTAPGYKLFADYKRKIVNKGKKGAMGLTTQGTVESIDINKIGEGDRMKMTDLAVYDCVDGTTYLIEIGNDKKKISNAKSLIRLFPAKQSQIEAYLKDNKVSFGASRQIIPLIDLCTNP